MKRRDWFIKAAEGFLVVMGGRRGASSNAVAARKGVKAQHGIDTGYKVFRNETTTRRNFLVDLGYTAAKGARTAESLARQPVSAITRATLGNIGP